MTILGIDWGAAKIGLAIATSGVAEPYSVIRYKRSLPPGGNDIKILWEALGTVIKKENVDRIIVGISEGKMGETQRMFAKDLSEKLNIQVETFDETLTTQEAQKLAIEAGIKRKKRKQLEDAFAATLMLQSYLDSYA